MRATAVCVVRVSVQVFATCRYVDAIRLTRLTPIFAYQALSAAVEGTIAADTARAAETCCCGED